MSHPIGPPGLRQRKGGFLRTSVLSPAAVALPPPAFALFLFLLSPRPPPLKLSDPAARNPPISPSPHTSYTPIREPIDWKAQCLKTISAGSLHIPSVHIQKLGLVPPPPELDTLQFFIITIIIIVFQNPLFFSFFLIHLGTQPGLLSHSRWINSAVWVSAP